MLNFVKVSKKDLVSVNMKVETFRWSIAKRSWDIAGTNQGNGRSVNFRAKYGSGKRLKFPGAVVNDGYVVVFVLEKYKVSQLADVMGIVRKSSIGISHYVG